MLLPLLLAAAVASASGGESAAPSTSGEARELAAFARAALAAEPAAGVVDAYKWLLQATCGGEHAAPSEAAARRWLEAEWVRLDEPRPGEPLLVPLRPDGSVVRLNLRPYRSAGGDREALLASFLASARSFAPSRELFVEAWRELGKGLSEVRDGPMSRAAWAELDRLSEEEQWPARHHGRPYAEAYAPAYRVLTGEAAASLVRGLGSAR